MDSRPERERGGSWDVRRPHHAPGAGMGTENPIRVGNT